MLRRVTLFIYTSRLPIYRTIKPSQSILFFSSVPSIFEAFPNKGRLTTFLTRRIIPKNANTAFIIFWLQNHDNLIISGMMGLGWAIPSRVVHHCWTRGQFGAENQVWRRWNGQPVILVIIVVILCIIWIIIS